METTASAAGTATEVRTAVKPKAIASGDKHIWGIFIALCIISVIELYSATSREEAL